MVDGDPTLAESTDYAACKLGGELAALERLNMAARSLLG